MGIELEKIGHRRMSVGTIIGLIVVVIGVASFRQLRHNASKPFGDTKSVKKCEQINPYHWRIPRLAKEEYFLIPGRLNEDLHLRPKTGADPESIDELVIAKVSKNSPMSIAGFVAGDRILMVNGMPVQAMSRALNLAHEIRASTRLTVLVGREGKTVEYLFDFE